MTMDNETETVSSNEDVAVERDVVADGPNEAVPASEAIAANAQEPAKKQPVRFEVSKPVSVQDQSELESVLRRHQEWISSVLNPRADLMEGRANLKGADLRGLNLAGRDLRGANLSHANLAGVDLSHCILNGANLSHADLTGAVLTGASVKRCNFDHSNLSNVLADNVDFASCTMHHVVRETVEGRVGATAVVEGETVSEQDVADWVEEESLTTTDVPASQDAAEFSLESEQPEGLAGVELSHRGSD